METNITPPTNRARGVSTQVFVLTIVLVLIVGFILGTRGNQIMAAVGPLLGMKVEAGGLDLAPVQQTYQQLKANYDGKLDTQKLIDGASRGMVQAAGDQYTVYMDKTEADAFENDLEGKIGGGVGAEIGMKNNKPTIIRVLADTPAQRAGLQANDAIAFVNDESAEHWTSEEAAKHIRGEVGTSVKIIVERDNEAKTFTITRQTISNPSVQSRVQDGIGVLTLLRFDSETGDLAKKAAEGFKQQGVKGVILDVRDNGGGYLDAAVDVASLWLNDKVVVSERTNGKVTDQLRSGTDPVLAGVPTVVLVNGNSASASEITAGALQDNGAATLVGEKTFGKGTVQRILDLPGGAVLKVTVARWYTPKGKNITKEGITPNQKVGFSRADADAGLDPQFDAAIGTLKK